jgi:hypothetical protein
MIAPLWSWLRAHAAGRRGTSLALTIAAHLLLLLLLLQTTNLRFAPPGDEPGLVALDIAPPSRAAARQERTQARRAKASAAEPPPPVPPAPVPPPQPVQPWTINPELAGFDLRDVPSTPRAAAGPPGPAEGDADGDSDDSVGTAPGGGRLYNAECVREPTDAELAFYMPRGVTGAGVVACRTVARNKVEDCREIGDSPPGAGIARGVREAAWQFLVRPPRKNGQPMIGSWVRIQITLTPRGSRTR